jgi:hypothetical protein
MTAPRPTVLSLTYAILASGSDGMASNAGRRMVQAKLKAPSRSRSQCPVLGSQNWNCHRMSITYEPAAKITSTISHAVGTEGASPALRLGPRLRTQGYRVWPSSVSR